MENLFDAATVAARSFRGAFASKVTLTGEEWNELCDDVVLSAVCQFLNNKVHGGGYCHEVSFYNNVFSCVMSHFNKKLDRYLNNVVKRKIQSLDGFEGVARNAVARRRQQMSDDPLSSTYSAAERLKDKPMPRYVSPYDGKAKAMKNLKSWLGRCPNESFFAIEDEDDFWSYIESCEELGIEPDKNSPLYKRGRYIK